MNRLSEVNSKYTSKTVKILGFDTVDKNLDMIKWLHLGEDFRQFIVNDVESALYEQDNGAQLQVVECFRAPEYKTDVLPDSNNSSIVTVMYFMVIFHLRIIVKDTKGLIWELIVEHKYEATPTNSQPKKINVCQNFTIVEQRQL